MSSSYEDSFIDDKKIHPFFMRNWETIVVSLIVVGTLIYLSTCESEYFANYSTQSNTQRNFSVLSNPAHDTPVIEEFKPSLYGTVQKGAFRPSKGVSTEQFVEFSKIDAVDELAPGEPEPTHRPETSDDVLNTILSDY